jgi:CO/xanthine dehydrogenase Mo-binding subunit
MIDKTNTILDFEQHYIPSGLSRRKFLKTLGGGLVIAVSISDFSLLYGAVTQNMPTDINAYLRVGEDGLISCFTGKIEMGQGVNTSLAQMMAEELDVTVASVRMIMGDTDLCPYDRGTWGSLTTRFFGPALRSAAAEARMVLIEMAAETLKVPANRLKVENGVVYDIKNKKTSITYAELTKGKKIIKSLKDKPKLKTPEEFKIIGKPHLRADATLKVTGQAQYAGDIRLPGMMYARILRPPAHGAKMTSIDTAAVEDIDGLQIVREGDLVAVLHESPDVVDKAIHLVKATFDMPVSNVDDKSIFRYLTDNASDKSTVSENGSLKQGRDNAETSMESVFYDGYVAHAPMETHTATAIFTDGKIKIWASTQNPFGVKSLVAKKLKMPEEKVQVLQNFVGGGFGGKSSNGQAIEAARLAKLSGKPVQVSWTRQEEFFYDTYRPAAVVKINSGITRTGKISFWDYGVYFAGARGANMWYDIPHHKIISLRGSGVHPFATGAWRAPGNNTNSFARESQINMMAEKARMDPLAFRLHNLKDERMIRVLKAAADKFGWTPIKPPSGKGYGIACGTDAGSYVAEMAEVEVNKKTGEVKVLRVVCAQDMGLVINPQGATIQVEGCIVMGLGYSLSEDIQFSGGDIHNKNFSDYKIPRFSWTPKIETVLIDAQNEPAQGGGEPAIVTVGGLIANAIYDACGARMYQLPMTPARILAAMA